MVGVVKVAQLTSVAALGLFSVLDNGTDCIVLDKADASITLGVADDEDTPQSILDKYDDYDYAISLGNLSDTFSVDGEWINSTTLSESDVLMLDKNNDLHVIPYNEDVKNSDISGSYFTVSNGITCVSDSVTYNVDGAVPSGVAIADTKDKIVIEFIKDASSLHQVKYDCETVLGDFASNIYIIPCDVQVFMDSEYILGNDDKTEVAILGKD